MAPQVVCMFLQTRLSNRVECELFACIRAPITLRITALQVEVLVEISANSSVNAGRLRSKYTVLALLEGLKCAPTPATARV